MSDSDSGETRQTFENAFVNVIRGHPSLLKTTSSLKYYSVQNDIIFSSLMNFLSLLRLLPQSIFSDADFPLFI